MGVILMVDASAGYVSDGEVEDGDGWMEESVCK